MWIMSNALLAQSKSYACSLAPVAASLGLSGLAGRLSVQLKTTPMPHLYLSSDKTKAFSIRSLSGMTSAHLPDNLGEDVLTWYLAGFPARTSAQPGEGRESRAISQGSGWKWPGSFAKFSLDTCTWKTRQSSLLGGLDEFSETWPRYGMMRDGESSELPTWARRIKGTAYGSWPTPCAMEPQKDIEHYESRKARPRSERGGGAAPNLATKVAMWPTPRANDSEKSGNLANDPRNGLPAAVRWPTPTATEGSKGSPNRLHRDGSPTLTAAVNSYPTPTSSMATVQDMEMARFSGTDPRRPKYADAFPTPTATNTKAVHQRGNDKGKPRESRSYFPTPTKSDGQGGPGNAGRDGGDDLRTHVGSGQLNPDWVELLMGWPRGWTSLEPMPRDVFDEWLYGDNHWGPDWEDDTPRVASNIKARAARLKCIGNGQVPSCMAEAWRRLNDLA